MFDFIKKKDVAPPDVGQEEAEALPESSPGEVGPKGPSAMSPVSVEKEEASTSGLPDSVSGGASADNIKIERIGAKVDSVVEWINQFYERFAYFSENIGELRAMNVSNEKKIIQATQEAEKVIDVVKEVKPEQLRLDYQRVEMRMQKWEEKVEANKQIMEDVMTEFNELKKKAEVFVGVEGVLKLNEEIKKDLLEIQKVDSKVRLNADKSEEIFAEIKNDFVEAQRIGELTNTLDSNYSGLKKEIEKSKLDFRRVISQADFAKFKKDYSAKLSAVESSSLEIEQINSKLESMERFIEIAVSAAKKNEEDIGNVALKVGDDGSKKIKDYENQISDILNIVGSFADQLSEMKKTVEGLSKKDAVRPVVKRVVKKAKVPVVKKVVPIKPVIEKPVPVEKAVEQPSSEAKGLEPQPDPEENYKDQLKESPDGILKKILDKVKG